jgi:hypothetical protein
MTDAFSKYVEIVATPNKEAPTVSLAIFNRWICRFGCPLEIVSDGGKEFVNQVSKELYKLLDIKHSKTTSYHPACNAQVERFNQTVAKYLASFTDSNTLDWEYYLPPLAFSYNTSLHRTTKATPYFLTYGAEARLPSFPGPDLQRMYGESQPGEWFQRLQQARLVATHHSLQSSARMEQDFNKKARPHNYQVGQMVWLQEMNFLGKNRKLAPNWGGPFQILKVFDFGVVDLACTNRIQRVNMDRIKPYVPPVGLQRRETETTTHQPTVLTNPNSTFYTRPVLQKRHFSQMEKNSFTEKFLPSKNSTENNFSQNTKNYLLRRYMESEKKLLAEKDRHDPASMQHEENEKVPDTDAPTVPQGPPPSLKRGRGRPRKAVVPPEGGDSGTREREGEDGSSKKPVILMPQFQRPPGRSVSLGTESRERVVTRSMSQATSQLGDTQIPGDGNVDLVTARDVTILRTCLSAAEDAPTERDGYGLPLDLGKRGEGERWAIKMRKFLSHLTVAQRNSVLTGDAAFRLDTTIYEDNSLIKPSPTLEEEDEEEDDTDEEYDEGGDPEFPVLTEVEQPVQPEQVQPDQVQTPAQQPKRQWRPEAERLREGAAGSPSFPDHTTRSGKTFRTPPGPGAIPVRSPWTRDTSPSSSSSSPLRSWGAKAKDAAKTLLKVPPPPGGATRRPMQRPPPQPPPPIPPTEATPVTRPKDPQHPWMVKPKLSKEEEEEEARQRARSQKMVRSPPKK